MTSISLQGKDMAQLLVRNLDEEVKARLKQRAERHGRSMEEEVRQILQSAALEDGGPAKRLGSRVAARFRKIGLTEDLPELHGEAARPADLRK